MSDRFIYRSLLIILLMGLLVKSHHSWSQQSPEAVKTAFIFNFAKFITWPGESSMTEFKICHSGSGDIQKTLSTLNGKSIKSSTVKIQALSSTSQVDSCNILFLGSSSSDDLNSYLSQIKQQPILIVSDSKGSAQKGAHLNFFEADSNIRFEANPKALEANQLKASSQLLKLAKIVK